MNPIDKLSEYFLKFPGIGPRQARRFVYFLLSSGSAFRKILATQILSLDEAVSRCASCRRFFMQAHGASLLCDICSSSNTDNGTLLVVEKTTDFDAIKKTNAYHGRYFILGGSLPILESNPNEKISARELVEEIKKQSESGALKEIILAMGATREGENTAQYVAKTLEPLVKKYSLRISSLGRGLSTGTELEYSDTDTFTSALLNRR
jgi:recombination protein RecR